MCVRISSLLLASISDALCPHHHYSSLAQDATKQNDGSKTDNAETCGRLKLNSSYNNRAYLQFVAVENARCPQNQAEIDYSAGGHGCQICICGSTKFCHQARLGHLWAISTGNKDEGQSHMALA
jgi:hypothetical protein